MRRLLFAALPGIAAAVVLLAAAAPVDGQGRPRRPTVVAPEPMPPRSSYEVEIVTAGSIPPSWDLGGQRWIEGRLGERYAIRVYNRSSRRVEAVASVDGRDAIDGQAASPGKRGYVIEPWGSVEIDGFRLSTQDVAAFRFTTVPDSYASRMGTPWTVGQISVSFFPERHIPQPPPLRPYSRHERREAPSSESSPSDRSAPRAGAQGLGTEFGERRWSPVHQTSFVRQDSWNPASRIVVRYDDRQGLCTRGIDALCEWRPVPRPSYPSYYEPPPERRFATPPPGWYDE